MKFKKIANILTKGKHDNFDDMYNIVGDCDQINNSLPTLIIGLELARECIKDFNILKKEYPEQNKYWTYKKIEKRTEYEEDVPNFCNKCLYNNLDQYEYVYIDIPHYTLSRIKNLIRYIGNEEKKNCFITKDSKFMFIGSKKQKQIYGISLDLCSFIGIPRKKVINKILRNINNSLLENMDFIPKSLKSFTYTNPHYVLSLYYLLKDEDEVIQ